MELIRNFVAFVALNIELLYVLVAEFQRDWAIRSEGEELHHVNVSSTQ